MVKKIAKFFGYLLFFLFALVAFMPKESFYFLLEKELKKFEVVISGERVEERLFSLEIESLSVSAKEIELAEIESAKIMILGLYNSVAFENIELSSLIESYSPAHIERARVQYSIINPLEITAFIEGEFGEAELAFTLLNRELNARVKPSEIMHKKYQKTMRMLKKDENGEYIYAKTLK